MKKGLFFILILMALAAMVASQDIFEALRQGDFAGVKALIEKDPGLITARDGNGRTPLHYAAIGGNADAIDYFVDKGAKLELQDAQMKTPLHLAATNDRQEAVAALLKRGVALETRDDYGRTALILCARERGQAQTGRILIEAGADVNAVDRFDDTALSLAAWRGKQDFVDLLIEKGARLPEPGEKWHGMLYQAASKGLEALFRNLAGRVRDVKEAAGELLLHAAAAGGSAPIVALLLDRGFDPALPDRFGWTPLHYAALDGRTEAARLLIGRGAQLNARSIMGQSAFDVAKERKMDAVAALLVLKKADLSGIRFPALQGDYLGQKPPTEQAELFGLGIISSIWGLHSTAVFSPDGSEVYWSPMIEFPGAIYSQGGLMMMRRVKNRWTAPAWAPFSGPGHNDDVPFFQANGKRIYFLSRRPLPDEKQAQEERIWSSARTASGWSEPKLLDLALSGFHMHWEFSLDGQGNVYFAGQAPDSLGMTDIYMARFSDGKYQKPVNLGAPVNSAEGEISPFIAPDGRYLLFSRQYDIWVSFRNADGTWPAPVKLGPEVNGPSIELCPVVTADGKYLFFLSQRDGESHAYWVSAAVIERARAQSGGGERGRE